VAEHVSGACITHQHPRLITKCPNSIAPSWPPKSSVAPNFSWRLTHSIRGHCPLAVLVSGACRRVALIQFEDEEIPRRDVRRRRRDEGVSSRDAVQVGGLEKANLRDGVSARALSTAGWCRVVLPQARREMQELLEMNCYRVFIYPFDHATAQ